MARVVGIHGVLNDYLGEESLARAWAPALRDGLRRAGYANADRASMRVVFYGDLFRERDAAKGGLPRLLPDDLTAEERELAHAWAAPHLDAAPSKARTPGSLQAALRALMSTDFFKALAGQHGERALLFGLREARLYLHDEAVRAEAQRRFAAAIGPDTTVVVGHSLGSVVAYEALCTGTFPQIRAFVSVGSPLGMRPVVFDRLRPAPARDRGIPPPVERWTNVADEGDLIALVKDLAPCFGEGVKIDDRRVHNGWESHSVLRYLTAEVTGRGVASGL